MKNYVFAIVCAWFVLPVLADEDVFVKHDIAISQDSQRIAYTVSGSGEVALVFVHGWSCDSRYWQNQILSFAAKYKVIAVDLAGHGNSSSSRNDYTISAFAKDVQSVLNNEGIYNAILIGHSMGGAVVASAAKLMPDKVKGIIGIDTFQNVSETISREVLDTMVNPFEIDFDEAMKGFVAEALTDKTDKRLKRWITEDMSSAPSSVAISAFSHYLGQYVTGESSSVFEELDTPVVAINAHLWPTSLELNRAHIKNFRLVYIENTGHFPMLESPRRFNSILAREIDSLLFASQK